MEESEIVLSIQQATRELNLPHEGIAQLDEEASARIVSQVKEAFVEGHPRVWWLSLKYPAKTKEYAEGNAHLHLREHIPFSDKKCWFIPETEQQSLPVFDMRIEYLSALLSEISFFEYYLVGKRLNWLVIETDHNSIVSVAV